MEPSIKLAHLALMDGDRDKVLSLIENEERSPEQLWLRAQSVIDEVYRTELLEHLVVENDPVFAPLAKETIQREKNFKEALSKPPDYQFWKKPSWHDRINSLKRQKVWWVGLGLIALVTLLFLLAIIFQKDSTDLNSTPQASVPVQKSFFALYLSPVLPVVWSDQGSMNSTCLFPARHVFSDHKIAYSSSSPIRLSTSLVSYAILPAMELGRSSPLQHRRSHLAV